MEYVLQCFRRRPALGTTSLLAGSLVWLVGFFLIPLFYLLAVSFAERSPYGTLQWVLGLQNYMRAFQPVYLEIYWRSLRMAVLTTLLCAVLGYPVAYTIALRVPAPWKSALLLLVVIPFWTSFLIRTYAWMVIFRTEGIINNVLSSLHLIHEPLQLLYTPLAVFVGLVYGELPFMILPLYAVLQKIDPGLLEAAQDLGANRWHTFLNVTLPLVVPGLVLVLMPWISTFTNDSGFNSPNRYAASRVEQWILTQPAIFPPPASLANVEFMRDVGPVVALYDRYWTEIKAR